MVFVRKVKTASGATAVQLAEYSGGRDRVIEHLGSAHTEAELAVLLEVARAKAHQGQDELELDWARPTGGTATVHASASNLLIHAIRSAWNRLGFNTIGDEAFFALVLARLVEPTSKVDSLRVLAELGYDPPHRNTFTATMKRCATRGYRDQIATACFAHAATAGAGAN